jgi:hypothetical protein
MDDPVLEAAISAAEAACPKGGWAVLVDPLSPEEAGMPTITPEMVVGVACPPGVDWRDFSPDMVIAWDLFGDVERAFYKLAKAISECDL